MTIRKVKRLLNESDDWLVFTMKKVNEDEASMGAYYRNLESWEILLNLAVSDYHIRETLRNVLNAADTYRDEQAQDSSE
jgi:hypothetical protein